MPHAGVPKVWRPNNQKYETHEQAPHSPQWNFGAAWIQGCQVDQRTSGRCCADAHTRCRAKGMTPTGNEDGEETDHSHDASAECDPSTVSRQCHNRYQRDDRRGGKNSGRQEQR